MRRPPVLRVVLFLLTGLAGASVASAQASRTWVSGVGDDANPCSRTAPCKTFAGAISKTAAGGEINVLDPGGFGAVTITKSITISSESFEAGVLVSGTNGIVINAGANDVVVIRGLDLEGLGTGLDGVKFLAGKSLHVENCTINHFTGNGINFTPGAAAFLDVRNTIIRNTSGSVSAGIRIHSSVNGILATAQLDNVRLDGNPIGLLVENTAKVDVSHSVLSNNSVQGVNANAVPAGFVPVVTISSSSITGNGTALRVAAAATVLLSDVTVSTNNVALNLSGGGVVISWGNNPIAGNTSGEPPTAGFSAISLQ
jgi:hypothetical protein